MCEGERRQRLFGVRKGYHAAILSVAFHSSYRMSLVTSTAAYVASGLSTAPTFTCTSRSRDNRSRITRRDA